MSEFIDLENQQFNSWTVLGLYAERKDGGGKWVAECECKNIKIVTGYELTSGSTRSCMTCSRRKGSIDLSNQRFGRLIAIERHEKRGNRWWWRTICDCGKETIVKSDNLREGVTKSCGCLHDEVSSVRLSQQNKIADRKGPKNPSWKGGVTSEYSLARSSDTFANWRIQVFERDHYTCQKCHDATGGNLNAHHILNFHDHKELRYEISNGICLCESCHNYFHKIYGTRINNQYQLLEYLYTHGS